ncbi:DNA-binding transcriptional regulator, LysR family [Caloramator quimbayensis]|uniref:DNA-binding transcriptional regulator, LysR family n=1 Tax=Caloramator quimbayensis TaxID=1147123 RepID=A0A1T4WX74_9CLOT|nr:LysR family transcriptional regulator [Caloramator quimbayensis]SKA81241.1 DNA-binding transcriptional regulator, LysR family [Caloramator quimbayensis]
MNIDYLRGFIETAKYKSISKASKNLHLTQSALSQQIQSIEKSIGSELLLRSNKGIELTKEGEIVFAYAETLINIYDNMKKDIEQSKLSDIKKIKISTCNSVGEYLIPCTLHIYKKKHPNIKFTLKSEHSKQVIEHVIDNTSDIGFIDKEINNDFLECYKISENNLVFIASSKLYKNNQNTISIDEVSKMPLIITQSGSGFREIVEEIFIKNGIPLDNLNIEMELDTIESIKASVSAGHGVSIVPYSSIKKEIYSKSLICIPIDEAACCNICIIYKKEKTEQAHIKDFISFIKQFGKKTFC